jgi:hypothetical protein
MRYHNGWGTDTLDTFLNIFLLSTCFPDKFFFFFERLLKSTFLKCHSLDVRLKECYCILKSDNFFYTIFSCKLQVNFCYLTSETMSSKSLFVTSALMLGTSENKYSFCYENGLVTYSEVCVIVSVIVSASQIHMDYSLLGCDITVSGRYILLLHRHLLLPAWEWKQYLPDYITSNPRRLTLIFNTVRNWHCIQPPGGLYNMKNSIVRAHIGN